MGVNMATLIVETKKKIKFSFRSIGNFSVNDFAKKNFNGGGHKNAAGVEPGRTALQEALAYGAGLDTIAS